MCPRIMKPVRFAHLDGGGLIGACIYDLKLALEVHPGTQGEEHLPEGRLAIIVVGPMLGTNVLSTSLIAWKAWRVT